MQCTCSTHVLYKTLSPHLFFNLKTKENTQPDTRKMQAAGRRVLMVLIVLSLKLTRRTGEIHVPESFDPILFCNASPLFCGPGEVLCRSEQLPGGKD